MRRAFSCSIQAFPARSPSLASRLLAMAAALFTGLVLSMAVADAGSIAPALQSRVASMAPGQRVRVIVNLASKVDVTTFRRGKASAPDLIRALRFKADATQPAVLKFLGDRGVQSGVRALWINNSLALEASAAVIHALATRPDVATIELDSLIRVVDSQPTNSTPSAERPGQNFETTTTAGGWEDAHLTRIRVPELWNAGLSGQGVVVGSIDTGFDPNHPALAGKWRGGTNSWLDIVHGSATPYDDNGHGTHTIGTMVGGDGTGPFTHDTGVAYGATFIAAKAIYDVGAAYPSDLYSAMQWMLDPDGDPATNDFPDIVNNSWLLIDNSSGFDPIVTAWRAAGIIPVFAIGNSGPTAGTTKSPGNYASVIGVGATTSSNDIAYFSSRGPAPIGSPWPADGRKPDLAAPGDSIVSTVPGGGYAAKSGTSMASPHVAGVIALLKSGKPSLTFDEALSSLVSTACDLGASGYDYSFGYGLVDVYAAAAAAGSLPPSVVGPPLNLAAASGSVGVHLTWTASSSPSVLGYRVYGSSAQLDFQPRYIGTTSGLSFDDTGFGFGSAYYKVRSYTAADSSGFSGEARIEVCGYASGAAVGAGIRVLAMVPADFNGDAIEDVATVSNSDTNVTVCFGNGVNGIGDATFGAISTLPLGLTALSVLATDTNGDGRLDIVVGTSADSALHVYLSGGAGGIPDGTFSQPVLVPLHLRPTSMAVGDFNEDGISDLAIAFNSGATNSGVAICLGGGSGGIPDGTFGTPTQIVLGPATRGIVVGDFNDDGVQDLACTSGTNLTVLLGHGLAGDGDGTFMAATTVGSGGTGSSAATGDFNLDGITDLAVTDVNGRTISVFLGNGTSGVGDGTFSSAGIVLIAGGVPRFVSVADWNSDGVPDLAVVTEGPDQVSVFLGAGNGTFQSSRNWMAPGPRATAMAVGDWNHDGAVDLAVGTYDGKTVTPMVLGCQNDLPLTLTVTAPAAGDALIQGVEHALEWTKTAGVTQVDVQLSRDGGATWATIARNMFKTQLKWTPTLPATTHARLRVVDSVRRWVMAASAADFTIWPASALSVSGSPSRLALLGALPNPTHGKVSISFSLPERASGARLELLDVAGRRVSQTSLVGVGPGVHVLPLGGAGLRPGIYMVRLVGAGTTLTRKVVVLD